MGSTKDQLKAELQLICASAIGLKDFKVFIGHEHGNWGPEKPGSSFRENQIGPDLHKGMLAFDPAKILQPREQFKLLVPDIPAATACRIYAERMDADVHVGQRMDYDIYTQTFWFLAAPTNTCKVVALGQWNQNSIWIPDT
jgi:hypothetical protein